MDKILVYKDDQGRKASFRIDKTLGKGVFGSVYKAYLDKWDESLDFPSVLAIKVILLSDRQNKKSIIREIEANNTVIWKHILFLYFSQVSKHEAYLTYHYYNGGTLSTLLKARRPLPEKLAAQILSQLLKGLIAIHSN